MEASEELTRLLSEDALRNTKLLVFANKQDLPNAMSVTEISSKIGWERLQQMRPVSAIFPCSAIAQEGLWEGLDWLIQAPAVDAHDAPLPPPPPPPTATKEAEEARHLEELLTEWLQREDDADDVFLEQLRDYSLNSWDHRTHLRIAWLFLSTLDRREALDKIFQGIKQFIENSPRTVRASGRGTTFHETMVCAVQLCWSSIMLLTSCPHIAADLLLGAHGALCHSSDEEPQQ